MSDQGCVNHYSNRHRVTSGVELASMPEADLIERIAAAEREVVRIKGQIFAERAGTTDRGTAWLVRAETALRHTMGDLQMFRAERARRNKPVCAEADKRQERQLEMLRAHVLQAELKQRAAHVVAEAQRTRNEGRAGLFVAAAEEMLSKEERAAIWERAKEMFPDHAAFARSPTMREIMDDIVRDDTAACGRAETVRRMSQAAIDSGREVMAKSSDLR